MKRMLINATQQEELRVALVDGQRLYDLDIESLGHEQKKANIYKGKITKINPSLEAAFVSYGGERDGFLPLKEIAESYFPSNISGRRSIKHLQEGQEVLIQIEKEIRGKKGAALTTYISLAGSYLVLMPNDPRAGGVSRRIEGEERADLKRVIDALEKPKGMGVIARTAGVGKSQEELQQDLNALVNYWTAIQNESKNHPAPSLIHKESDIITRAFRDYLRDDVGDILIDNPKVLEIAKKRLADLGRVEYVSRLKLYEGDVPLFNHFQIEGQIESAFQREVRLPSGGSIVIDATEALTAIDINSAKSIRGSDIEETAFNTNLEAAEEIARQLRLRDLGGLIVIDFIDMTPIRNQREVENRLKEAMKTDRARIQTTRISRFGLLEMSRQRLSPSLREATHHICPRCQGTGTVRDNNSLSLSILRLIQEEAMKDNTVQIDVIVPVPIASYLLNEKRRAINNIERMHPDVKIVIAGDEEMETPLYKVIRKRSGEETDVLSYNLPKLIRELEEEEEDQVAELVVEQAVLSGPKVEASKASKAKSEPKKVEKSSGLFGGLFKKIRQLFVSEKVEPKPEVKPQSNKKRDNQRSNNRRQRNNRNNSAANNNVATDEVKETTRSNRRTKQNNNSSNAANNIKADKVVNEAAQPPKQKEAKPRRQQRALTKSVRVKNSDVPAQAEKVCIPTLLLPVIVPETGDNAVTNDSQPKRQRRTSRHLRMNTPRTKRRGKNSELKQSAMPLQFAAASLELALGRVSVDYSQVSHDESCNAVPVIPSLLLPIVIKDDVDIAKNVVASESQSNITTQANIEKSPTTQVTTESTADPAAGYSSSIMTKAPAPDYVESDSGIKTREELDYRYDGKGNAGGLSAQDHAYAAASKPVIPE
ncbi:MULTISPECIES: ribonuclease E [unclassified Gilliamella]|uniref:ribonuclease E n=1 Tax=unclassified Gilliamella TaxID=2685620 RepID=UPI00226A3AB3|nr:MULTISPECIES: ribonuclease E [unclassified Gilliamella]MCX8586580.1 ribonuclease E [Gilliamella sp. B3562]MCX8597015.1 ribonuclease E [Gilliamella sp. B3493]MCX8600106.1 ribonuclease E [Gilliamella sp. B3486]MCX8686143.1 ribonuclease E [Gilliamella sp. B2864]MCX8690364.1 ribonuclease E [Gilliamella sp. B2973]